MNRWPHQERCFSETTSAIGSGANGLCVTSPTGGGKTRMMLDLIGWACEERRNTILYTNRRLLLDQTQDVLAKAGIECGMRAAGYKPADWRVVQLASIQTEYSRVHKRKTWKPYAADLVLIDEAHVQGGPNAETIINSHKAAGAAVVGFTATPVDLAHVYDRLVVAGTNSELRACGAHVPCYTFAPDEPDLRGLKRRVPVGEDLTESEARQVMMRPGIFGRVLTAWRELNPEGRPTILFGPDVRGSLWFCEQFRAAGIPAAHIDGEWISYGEIDDDGNPVLVPSTKEERAKVLAGSEDGSIQVLCNRFVLREGIDAPWIAHCIMATVFGALSSYLQAGGRLLRSHPSLDSVTLQDHGGNWWRHGSLNSDREWDLTWTNSIIGGLRATQLREKREQEPLTCPKCHMVRMGGSACPRCKFVATNKCRAVVQSDGTLKEMTGDIFRARRIAAHTDRLERDWVEMYHRAKSKKWNATFAQAEALFAQEHNWAYPPRDLPMMPTSDVDWFRKVRDVPKESLRPATEPPQQQRSFA